MKKPAYTMPMNNHRTTIAYWTGFAGLLIALLNWNWTYFAIAVGIHVAIITLFSAVVHRYFCHRAYEANPTLMWFLSIIPVMYSYATPSGWAYMHTAHHAFPDTEKDPHIKGFKGLVTAAYRLPPAKYALAARWFHDARHMLLHEYAAAVVIAAALTFLAISPTAFVWFWCVPVFTLHFSNCLHRCISHDHTGALNRWYLEYIFPMGGEWMHKTHHVAAHARDPHFKARWFEPDTGGILVKLLKKTA